MPTTITKDFSQTIGAQAGTVFTVDQMQALASSRGGQLYFMQLTNSSATDTIWLSRSGVAAPNTLGSFALMPETYQLFQYPQAIPLNTLSAISTGSSTPFTVEVG